MSSKHTSQSCTQCGYKSKGNCKELEQFKCVKCGYEANAGIKDAQNSLRRAGCPFVLSGES